MSVIHPSLPQVDSQESSRQQKKAEVLENLKRLYPGVVRREEEGGEGSCLMGVGCIQLNWSLH